MPAHPLIDVTCPCCAGRFVERANLLRPGGEAWCPYCEKLFALEGRSEIERTTLEAARVARKRRKQRLNDLRQSWGIAPATPLRAPGARPARTRPMTMSDVLRNLDGLLERLDTLAGAQGLSKGIKH